ncbi:MAG: sensor histidine kinase [Flavobacteriaceae bacterium]|nr:sensor histidine kinase [Flavobacteriaceae bacterium]
MKIKLAILVLLFVIIKLNAQNDSIYLKNLFDRAYNYEQTKPDSALFLYNKIIKLANKTQIPIFEAKANNYKGIVFSDIGKYDSAVFYYNKSIAIFKIINNEKGIAANLINIGNTFQLQGELKNSVSYYLDGIAIYENLKDDFRLSISYGNLATIFDDINQKEDAKNSLWKSNKFAKKVNDSVQLVYNHYNLTDLYFDEGIIDSAFVNLEKAKKYLNNSSNNHLKYLVSYGEARYFIEVNKLEQALIISKKALGYVEQTKNPYYLALTYSLVGKVYFKQKKYSEALKETHKGLEIAKKYNSKANLIKINSQLSSIYSQINENKKALFYKNLQYKYKDTVLNEKQKKNINFFNIKYQTEKKDKEIIQQQLQLEKKESELQIKKTQTNYLIGLSIFLIVASILAWFLFQQRQKRKNQEIVTLKREHQIKTLESLIEGEEKERFRIAKELHDGVNGDLSAIKYKLSTLLEMNNTVIKEAITMIDNSCSQVRAISHNLVPPSLDNFNLIEAVEEYCEKSDSSHTQKITFQHLGNHLEMSKKEEINVFRIIQELVTNSIKHAKATEINVQISCRNKIVQITVEDNGVGFDVHNADNKGVGLNNIQSRVGYLHAKLDVISNRLGTSTTIEIDKNKDDSN